MKNFQAILVPIDGSAHSEHPYDLIIMGSRGLTNLQQIIMGSVSQYTVNHAACPVMVVR